jgi:hypothetical protein
MGAWTAHEIFYCALATLPENLDYIAGKKYCITSRKNPPWSFPQCGVWLGWDRGTPIDTTGSKVVDINKYRWEKH